MIIFYSGNAGVPRVEPETCLRGKGNVMLTFHYLGEGDAQVKRFNNILRARGSDKLVKRLSERKKKK